MEVQTHAETQVTGRVVVAYFAHIVDALVVGADIRVIAIGGIDAAGARLTAIAVATVPRHALYLVRAALTIGLLGHADTSRAIEATDAMRIDLAGAPTLFAAQAVVIARTGPHSTALAATAAGIAKLALSE
jgi:hypothetical protein